MKGEAVGTSLSPSLVREAASAACSAEEGWDGEGGPRPPEQLGSCFMTAGILLMPWPNLRLSWDIASWRHRAPLHASKGRALRAAALGWGFLPDARQRQRRRQVYVIEIRRPLWRKGLRRSREQS